MDNKIKDVLKITLDKFIKENTSKDISNFKGCYWAEVSDAIEYFFKKINGYPIPDIFAF